MKFFLVGSLRIATMLIAVLGVSSCSTNSKLPDPVSTEQLVESSAIVTAIDVPARMLTVTTQDGSRADVMLDPTVKNIDRIRVGDRVIVSYYQGIAAEVKQPGEGVKGVETTAAEGVAGAGEQPGAAVGTKVRTTVSVVAIDTKQNTITVRLHDGGSRTLNVVKAKGQEFIRHLRVGDEVEISYTEAVAVAVRPAN